MKITLSRDVQNLGSKDTDYGRVGCMFYIRARGHKEDGKAIEIRYRMHVGNPTHTDITIEYCVGKTHKSSTEYLEIFTESIEDGIQLPFDYEDKNTKLYPVGTRIPDEYADIVSVIKNKGIAELLEYCNR